MSDLSSSQRPSRPPVTSSPRLAFGTSRTITSDGSLLHHPRSGAHPEFFDDYVFYGSWDEIMRQLGNAVPVKLAEAVTVMAANGAVPAAAPGTRRRAA
jgi:DNA (cytosine-5)-methyltransferase 1